MQVGSQRILFGASITLNLGGVDATQRVRAARGAKNMSLDEFADAIGIGRQTLIRIENGSRTPRDHEYEKMADVSGLPLAFFYVDLDVALGGPPPGANPIVSDLTARMGEAEKAATRQGQELEDLRVALTELQIVVHEHARAIEELRDTDHQTERPEEDGPDHH